MSKPPSSYTIHITYSGSSSGKKPSSYHQGQGKSVFSSVVYLSGSTLEWGAQRPRIDSSKRFLPRTNTTAA